VVIDFRKARSVEAADNPDATDNDRHAAPVSCVLDLTESGRLIERRPPLLVLHLRGKGRSVVPLDGTALARDPVIRVGESAWQRCSVGESAEVVNLDDQRQILGYRPIGRHESEGDGLTGGEGGKLEFLELVGKFLGCVITCGHVASVSAS